MLSPSNTTTSGLNASRTPDFQRVYDLLDYGQDPNSPSDMFYATFTPSPLQDETAPFAYDLWSEEINDWLTPVLPQHWDSYDDIGEEENANKLKDLREFVAANKEKLEPLHLISLHLEIRWRESMDYSFKYVLPARIYHHPRKASTNGCASYLYAISPGPRKCSYGGKGSVLPERVKHRTARIVENRTVSLPADISKVFRGKQYSAHWIRERDEVAKMRELHPVDMAEVPLCVPRKVRERTIDSQGLDDDRAAAALLLMSRTLRLQDLQEGPSAEVLRHWIASGRPYDSRPRDAQPMCRNLVGLGFGAGVDESTISMFSGQCHFRAAGNEEPVIRPMGTVQGVLDTPSPMEELPPSLSSAQAYGSNRGDNSETRRAYQFSQATPRAGLLSSWHHPSVYHRMLTSSARSPLNDA